MKPRIWVGSLHDYNCGELVGKWIDLSDFADAEELLLHIEEYMQSISIEADDGIEREEWEVMESDLGNIPISQWPSIEELQAIYDSWELMDELGEDVVLGGLSLGLAVDRIEDVWLGTQESATAWAEEFMEGQVPEHLEPYFDYSAYARDSGLSFIEDSDWNVNVYNY